MRRFLMASALLGVMVVLGFSTAQDFDPKMFAVMKTAMPILASNPATPGKNANGSG